MNKIQKERKIKKDEKNPESGSKDITVKKQTKKKSNRKSIFTGSWNLILNELID